MEKSRRARSADSVWLAVNGVVRRVRVHRCDSFLKRLRGMLLSGADSRHDVWCLHPCNAVHTLMLARAIDVVFCDRDGLVLRVCAATAPWRFAFCRSARSVWELPAGQAARWQVIAGKRLQCWPT